MQRTDTRHADFAQAGCFGTVLLLFRPALCFFLVFVSPSFAVFAAKLAWRIYCVGVVRQTVCVRGRGRVRVRVRVRVCVNNIT